MERLNITSDGVLVKRSTSSSSLASSSSSWSMLSSSSSLSSPKQQEHQKGITDKRYKEDTDNNEAKEFFKPEEHSDVVKVDVDSAEVVAGIGERKRRKIKQQQDQQQVATADDNCDSHGSEENHEYEFIHLYESNSNDEHKSDDSDERKRPAAAVTAVAPVVVFNNENIDERNNIIIFPRYDENNNGMYKNGRNIESVKDEHFWNKVLPALKDDPEYQKYFEMLKVGLSSDVVKHAMKRDGKDSDAMDFDCNHRPSLKTDVLEDSPVCAKYLQISEESIKRNSKKDGIQKPSKQGGESTGTGNNENEVLFRDDPEYTIYFKMLKMQIPMAVVKNALQRNGKDPSIMDLDPNRSLRSQIQSSEEEYGARLPLKEDSELTKYSKMLKVGIPMGAVKNALKRDGKDPSIMMDSDPQESLQTQFQTKSKKANNSISPNREKVKVMRKQKYWNPIDTSEVKQDSLLGQIKGSVNIEKDSSESENLFSESMDHRPKDQSNFLKTQLYEDHSDGIHRTYRVTDKATASSDMSYNLNIFDSKKIEKLSHSQKEDQSGEEEDGIFNISEHFDVAATRAFVKSPEDNMYHTGSSPSKTNVEIETTTAHTSMSDEVLAKILQEDEDYLYALSYAADNDVNAEASLNTTASTCQDVNSLVSLDRDTYKYSLNSNASAFQQHYGSSEKKDIAWDFVQSVIESHRNITKAQEGTVKSFAPAVIEPIASDSMYDVAQNMIRCKENFRALNKPVEVTLAYHYTHQKCVDSISQDGLVVSDRVGFFGKGIYLASNACAFRDRGPVGIIVAILKGKCQRVSDSKSAFTKDPLFSDNNHADTLIGNKKFMRTNHEMHRTWDYHDEIVLQESRQCIPIIKFDSALVDSNSEQIWIYHQQVQKIVDVYFNNGASSLLSFYTESDIFPPDKIINRSQHHIHHPPRQQHQNHFDDELCDNAAAYLLMNESMPVEDALKLAGFVDFDVQDLLLQKDVANLVFDLRKNVPSSLHHLDAKAMFAAQTMITSHPTGSSSTIRFAMQATGFVNTDIANRRKRNEVLKCLAFDNVSFGLVKNCMNLTTAAYLLVLDESLTYFAALKHVGFDDIEASDPSKQREVQRRACEISIQTNSVLMNTKNSTLPTLSGDLGVYKNIYSKLDCAAKFLAMSHHASTRLAMISAGFKDEEAKDSHFILHTRIKSSFLKITLS